MDQFSQENIKKNCPHCHLNSYALKYQLQETKNFWIVCDCHPLIEGHILIIPKKHLSCMGKYSKNIYQEFLSLFDKFSIFIKRTYGSISSFEHGIIGQTVFHSHIHLFPFDGTVIQIIPEGEKYLTSFDDFSYLKFIYEKEKKYLYFSINQKKWIVNPNLGAPRFFRDRFAKALKNSDRGNWKKMAKNKKIMEKAFFEIKNLEKKWSKF